MAMNSSDVDGNGIPDGIQFGCDEEIIDDNNGQTTIPMAMMEKTMTKEMEGGLRTMFVTTLSRLQVQSSC